MTGSIETVGGAMEVSVLPSRWMLSTQKVLVPVSPPALPDQSLKTIPEIWSMLTAAGSMGAVMRTHSSPSWMV